MEQVINATGRSYEPKENCGLEDARNKAREGACRLGQSRMARAPETGYQAWKGRGATGDGVEHIERTFIYDGKGLMWVHAARSSVISVSE